MRHLIISLSILLSWSCTTSQQLSPEEIYKDGVDETRPSRTAVSDEGMVVAAHHLASEAGRDILDQGGNAVDAAIAVSFVISVVRPQSTGIGGGGFLLYYDKGKGETKAYDFRETAPGAATTDMYLDRDGKPADFLYKGKMLRNASVNGHLAVGTPGLIRGLWDAHQAHGKLPWKDLVQHAIKTARDGFPVYPSLARALKRRKGVMTVFPASAKIFYPKGEALEEGEMLVQTDLSKTLEAIAEEGVKVFYEGWIAEKIVAEMESGGGIMTAQDLKEYETKIRQPVEGSYHGLKILSMPPPSSGGVHIAQILNILEGYDLKKLQFQSTAYINLLAEAMRLAYADRALHLGDPDFHKVPVAGLTSKAYATELRKLIVPGSAGNSEKINPGNPTPYESPSTTHFSIVDKDGNAVSSTQTINISFGSGVVADGTGIVLNDEMDDFSKKAATPNAFGLIGYEANKVVAKKRMLSSMSPTLVFENDELSAVVGSPGGSRIITATLQTILNRFQFKMSPQDAVHASRVHHQWKPDRLFYEKESLNPEIIADLKQMGYKMKSTSYPVGDVQAIFKEGSQWIGVSDIRSEGRPVGQTKKAP